MPTHLLLAPAGHGKTRYAIDRIRAVLASEPLAPVAVILPNQTRVAEFRRRLAAAGGALGVNLFTFHTLYAELLTRAGEPKARLLEPVQVQLLRTIVDQLWREGSLRHYASLRAKPGFVAVLRDTIQELKRARVFPKEFFSAVKGLGPRIEELAAIYNAYQDWLLREDWADPEGQGWLAAIALDEHPDLGRELRLLVVNGFDEFNPTQLVVLTLLARHARETLITLTGDPQRSRLAHRRFHRAQEALTTALDLEIETLATDAEAPRDLPALAYIENNLFEPGPHPPAPSPNTKSKRRERGGNLKSPPSNLQSPITFFEAQNRAEEARAALRWVKTRVVQDGVPLSEAAVLARDLDPYRPFLEETAAEFGLPLRLVGGRPLAENPGVAALLALLSLSVLDWPRRPLLDVWRSPYFDWSTQKITPADVAALDAASRAGHVVAGLNQWHEAFDLLAQKKPPDETIADEDYSPLSRETAEGPGVRAKFDAFVTRLTPPARVTVREYTAFVENLIGDDPALATRFAPTDSSRDETSLRIVARARENPHTAQRDVAALRAFKDVLRGLVLAEAALGADPGSYAAFFEELRSAVKATTYSAASETGVLVASALDARALSFRAVALLGLSEGEFPQPERENAFLRESDRAELRKRGLSIEPKLRGDEVTFFYQAVTRARECLLLSRPYLADDGQAWEASPYWLQAWRLLGEPKPNRVRPETPLAPDEAASQPEFIAASGQFDSHLARGIEILRSRLAASAAGAHEGELPQLAALLATRYPATHGWSASRLEAYGACGFYFFIAYALGLEPRTPPEEGYDVRILGSMLHQILENTYRQAADPTDLNQCLHLLPEIAKGVFDAAPADYGCRPTPLWELQQQELERILRETMIALAEVSEGYTPCYFEERFGMGQPSLLLSTEIGDVRLHGYIDRVDEGPDGRLRVVDYKAGGAAISARHLTQGQRLQLPLYALAAREALGLGEIGGGFYWHIGRAAASSLKLEKYDGGVEGAFETAVQHIAAHVRDIRAGRFQPQPPADGCPKYCPAVGFCWRYTPKR